jgi:hypothetical protein
VRLLNLEMLRSGLVGVAGGVIFSVFYLRGEPGLGDRLAELRDTATLLIMLSLGVSIWQRRVARGQEHH